MSRKIKKIKVKEANGTFSEFVDLGADAVNIDMQNGSNLQSTIGEINIDKEGSIAKQIDTIGRSVKGGNAYNKEILANQYVRLFSFQMSSAWKNSSILFHINSVSDESYSQLVNLSIKKDRNEDSLRVHDFKALNFYGNLSSQLVAIVTASDLVEVYCKMLNSQTPAIGIISVSKANENDESGKLEIDCQNVKNALPGGVQAYVSNMFR